MQKPNIAFDQFLALDIRICEIISSERVPKKDKLLKLVINTGIDERVAVTNIGAQFSPESLVGKKMPFILNLEPTTIAGIESTAMIIAVTGEEKQAILFSTETEVKTGNIVI